MHIPRWSAKVRVLGLFLTFLGCDSSSPESPEGSKPAPNAATNTAPDDPRFVWDLTDLYPTVEAWDQARRQVLARLPELSAYGKTLTESPTTLQAGLDLYFELLKSARRVEVYANLGASVDLKSGPATERKQQAVQMMAQLAETASFMSPAILQAGADKIQSYMKKNPGLDPYAFFLRDRLRQAPHTLTPQAESVLAATVVLSDAPSDISSTLLTADVDFPQVELGGDSVRMDQAGFVKYRSHPNRSIRKITFDRFFGTLKEYESTFGRILAQEVAANLFQVRSRRYSDVLDWALADSNVPGEVYTTLVEEVNAALPTLHRYLKLRGRMLEVSDLSYHDLYPALVELDAEYDLETSRKLTLEALAPLGEPYIKKLEFATRQRWQHVLPSETKRGGAFMAGSAYDVHPYIMLNHNGSYDSLSTYAHEWGHAVHTLLANEAQPFPTARYATFLAEVASIGNELFLSAHMLEHAKDDSERLFFLGQELETFRTTYFRQAMFAEFELAIHREVEDGGALSGERISAIYRALLEKYYGHHQGVVRIQDPVQAEWMFVPHFYYDFYVFQYATSIAGGALLVEKVLQEGDAARERLLTVFKAGGSDYPYEILKRAGIDLAEPEAHRALISRMNRVLDRVEALLSKG